MCVVDDRRYGVRCDINSEEDMSGKSTMNSSTEISATDGSDLQHKYKGVISYCLLLLLLVLGGNSCIL